jgi:hypothetical protein
MAANTTDRSRHAAGRPRRGFGGIREVFTFVPCIDPFGGSLNTRRGRETKGD